MLGYICKYTPIEIFKSINVGIELIEPSTVSYCNAESCMHPLMCSYIKGVFEEFSKKNLDGMILTSCCDSSNRLYDVLKENFPNKFFYLIDLPRKINTYSIKLFYNQIINLIKEYENYKHTIITISEIENNLLNIVNQREVKWNFSDKIVILGSRCSNNLYSNIQEMSHDEVINLTCNDFKRSFLLDKDNILFSYCSELLSSFECLRMEDIVKREQVLENVLSHAKAIIYHSVKFCDIYSYEASLLKKKSNIPILFVESENSCNISGQLKTRLEAFFENLKINNKVSSMINHNGKYVLGVDSGSTSTNAVLLDMNKKIVGYKIIRTGAKANVSASLVKKRLLDELKITDSDIILTISTGYGRISIDYSNFEITEISCHAKGAYYLDNRVRTILDIGGQDSKVIKLNDKGQIVDFVMNDKCAAGTGRFLEMICSALSIPIEQMGDISLDWNEDIEISSTCSVFAESEVISLVAENKELKDILHGINKSIAKKSIGLLKRVDYQPKICMTGGVAKNSGVVQVLEDLLNQKLIIYKEPEIIGALGAALFALEKVE